MKTLVLLVSLSLGVPAAASPADDLLRTFARCAGQLLAATEHAWLIQDPRAETYEGQRAAFLALLEAVTPEARAAEARSFRISARAAQRALLNQASFGADRQKASWAERRATYQLQQCQGLVLGS